METFRQSIDWNHELAHSAVWVANTWAITAACVVLIAALLVRFTTWGRQFWVITGDYFAGAASVRVWGVVAVLLLSVMIEVRIDVLMSYYSNDLYSALQVAFQGAGAHNTGQRNSGIHGFWMAIVIFSILAIVRLVRILFDTYLTQRFIVRWRVWLTDRLTTHWLHGRAYYRGRFTDAAIDNPDQRIQQDIDVFTTGVGTGPNIPSYYSTSMLLFGAIRSVVSVASFTVILWKLSGPLTLFGVTVPKALFWTVITYVLLASMVAFRIGHPLIRLSFRNEQTNAAFRYALVRLRDSAEAIAFYRGERAERGQLDGRFGAVIANYRRYVRRTIALMGWNFTLTQAIVPLPFVLQAPRLFAGAIKLGDVTQSATAFGKIESGLSFFRNAYTQFASYNAAIIRLYGLVEADDRARQLPSVLTEPSPDDSIELDGVGVRTPAGDLLIDGLDLRLQPGESLVITGPSGSGKTTLMRSLAELWPGATGRWYTPSGSSGRETMFVPQLPYVPLGDLRAAVSYPDRPGDIGDARLREVLVQVSLANLRDRLGEEQDWANTLSPGEQQRIAFARVLLTRPKVVFLDEATSALDEGMEFAMYQLVQTELPDTILVSIGHHSTVDQHHHRHLELLGDGGWRLGPVTASR